MKSFVSETKIFVLVNIKFHFTHEKSVMPILARKAFVYLLHETVYSFARWQMVVLKLDLTWKKHNSGGSEANFFKG